MQMILPSPKAPVRLNKAIAASIGAAAVLCGAALLLPRLVGTPSRQPDENGMYEQNGYWVQVMGEENPAGAEQFAQKLQKLKANLLTENNHVYYAIIPDKSHYLPREGWPVLDLEQMQQTVRKNLPADFVNIDLQNALTLESYYKTDGHWRQEKLQPVLDALGSAMGFSADCSNWTANTLDPFVGSYGKYISGAAPEEDLVYLTSPFTETAKVDNFQYPEDTSVYSLDKLSTNNAYDVFLNGATPLVTIENPNASTDRSLVIFRDSYSSSLAPLLCGTYRTITLIDIRYMVSGLVPQYVTFTDQDVLFLYSSWVVNQSSMLR